MSDIAKTCRHQGSEWESHLLQGDSLPLGTEWVMSSNGDKDEVPTRLENN